MYVLLLAPVVAFSAPSKQDKEEVSTIVSGSGQTLGEVIECDREDLHHEYVAVLHDAMNAYPGTDPTKVRALIRKIESQAQTISRLGFKGITSPTPEDLEFQRQVCEKQIARAKNNMRTLNEFILK